MFLPDVRSGCDGSANRTRLVDDGDFDFALPSSPDFFFAGLLTRWFDVLAAAAADDVAAAVAFSAGFLTIEVGLNAFFATATDLSLLPVPVPPLFGLPLLLPGLPFLFGLPLLRLGLPPPTFAVVFSGPGLISSSTRCTCPAAALLLFVGGGGGGGGSSGELGPDGATLTLTSFMITSSVDWCDVVVSSGVRCANVCDADDEGAGNANAEEDDAPPTAAF